VSLAPPRSPGDEIHEGTLLRRVPPDNACFPHGVASKPSNSAYRPKSEDEGISAFLEEMITREQVLAGHPGFALISISVIDVVALGFTVRYNPPPLGHVLITGGFTHSKRRQLSACSAVVVAGDADLWRTHAEGEPDG
jgi:hypothetical protein